MHKAATTEVNRITAYYQVEAGVSEHARSKIDDIFNATNILEADKKYQKALDSGFMHCLAAWSKGEAKGPRTKAFLLKEAKKEDAFAERMETKGFKMAAAKHKAIALNLWTELKQMG